MNSKRNNRHVGKLVIVSHYARLGAWTSLLFFPLHSLPLFPRQCVRQQLCAQAKHPEAKHSPPPSARCCKFILGLYGSLCYYESHPFRWLFILFSQPIFPHSLGSQAPLSFKSHLLPLRVPWISGMSSTSCFVNQGNILSLLFLSVVDNTSDPWPTYIWLLLMLASQKMTLCLWVHDTSSSNVLRDCTLTF